MQDATTPVAKENFSGASSDFDRDAGSGPGVGRAVASATFWPFLALLAGNAALASGPLFVRLSDVGPVAAGFWRLALALPVLAMLAWREARGRRPGDVTGGAIWLAAAAGLFFGADIASWHLGILQTKMANATLFGNSASLILPLVTLAAAWRWPHRAEAAALILAAIGAFLLMRESGQQGQAQLTGDLLCLLAGILYAGYMLAMQRARRTISAWPALTAATAAGLFPLLAVALLLGERLMPGDWTPLLLLALTSQIIGQGLLIYALRHFSALVIGLTLLTQPAVSALIGWLVYRESLSAMEALGGALIAIALVIIRLPQAPSGQRAAPAIE